MKKIISSVIVFLLLQGGAYAAGSFSTGIVFGLSGDGGSMTKTAGNLNREMREIKAANPLTDTEEVPVYYTPSVTVFFTYFYNRLMLRLGWEYATTPFYNEKGSIDPPGNDIEIEYYRFTFPVSAGLVIPAGNRTRFYFAGGVNMTYAVMEINQTNPGTFTSLPEKENTYSAYLPGFHMKFGAEAVLSRNYSLLFEFTRYMGRYKEVENETGNSEVLMGLDTFEISAGLNYNVNFGN